MAYQSFKINRDKDNTRIAINSNPEWTSGVLSIYASGVSIMVNVDATDLRTLREFIDTALQTLKAEEKADA